VCKDSFAFMCNKGLKQSEMWKNRNNVNNSIKEEIISKNVKNQK
jgi:hypothetical protein